ncbi:hypothetical protein E2C01_046950 [Portunus trituberculatus]|uniref:Uncharacterized protein n=1 Tax=Portunus trituberculatus TaxID=210409 RepID=A0A5B7G6F3_PORTR|nr:hypothetical protein [Portunus trituberculatus]
MASHPSPDACPVVAFSLPPSQDKASFVVLSSPPLAMRPLQSTQPCPAFSTPPRPRPGAHPLQTLRDVHANPFQQEDVNSSPQTAVLRMWEMYSSEEYQTSVAQRPTELTYMGSK